MAKKAKIKKIKKRKQREPLVTVEPQWDVKIELAKDVHRECETVRVLGHRVWTCSATPDVTIGLPGAWNSIWRPSART